MKHLILISLAFVSVAAQAQTEARTDTIFKKEMEEVVVTATRSERNKGNLAVPVSLISQKQIQQSGSLRLQSILEEQAGISIVNSSLGTSLNGYPNPFGQGVQMLGLDPAYTLILLDGEPLIGRNAGILKLGRLTTGNIRQVEIVKGPASSLYGSEAMAGVINILTESPSAEKLNVQLHTSSNNTYSATGAYGNKFGKTAIEGFANYYSSNGYDLDKNLYGKTVDPYHNFSFSGKLIHHFSSKDQLTISARSFNEVQDNNYQIVYQGNLSVVKGHTTEKDLSGFVQWLHRPNKIMKWYFRTFYNRYSNDAFVNIDKTDIRFDETTFHQSIIKPEVQVERNKSNRSKYVAGAGVNFETIDANRYAGKRSLTNLYAFTQEEFYFFKQKLTVIAGGRLDKRNDFDLKVSPRLAVAYKPNDNWKFTASAGWGFKAPDFRHMYLSFYNAQIGYSLIGALELGDQLGKLQQQGQIDQSVDIAPYTHQTLRPENSFGVHIGTRYKKNNWLFELGLFRNDVNNLIEVYTLPFQKSNGQAIYSYHNINRIYTEGAEFSFSVRFLKNLQLTGGYQFLQSADKDVLKAIREGKLYKRDLTTLDVDTLRRKDYGGLFNRSKHSGNIKLAYDNEKQGWGAYARFVYRGRFGFTDLNGNAVLDDDKEYIKGFWLCNIAASKRIVKGLDVQAGVENLLDYTNASRLPQYPGRIFFINLNCQLDNLFANNKNKN